MWLEIKYTKLLGNSLNKFKIIKESPFLAKCRCPVCGDSKKNISKTRGFFFVNKENIQYKCFNCGYSSKFSNFLKLIDNYLYTQFNFEKFSAIKDYKIETKSFYNRKNNLDGLISVSDLDQNHYVIQYLNSRKIENFYRNFLYQPKFVKWANTLLNYELKIKEHPRLIIPFYDNTNKVFLYQARSFGKEEPKYFTIKLNEELPKIYGLNTVNLDKCVYVVEGAIDSMFLNNSIAISDANYSSNSFVNTIKNKIIVPDQEPRNLEIVNNISKVIDKGWNVCIIEENLPGKDINEWIVSGMKIHEVKYIIDKNVVNGLEARLKFQKWKKINNLEKGFI